MNFSIRLFYGRFEPIMGASGLECVELRGNVSDVKTMSLLSRIRPLREFFVNNVYTIWRKPLTVGTA
jgi:hypothetical protein